MDERGYKKGGRDVIGMGKRVWRDGVSRVQGYTPPLDDTLLCVGLTSFKGIRNDMLNNMQKQNVRGGERDV